MSLCGIPVKYRMTFVHVTNVQVADLSDVLDISYWSQALTFIHEKNKNQLEDGCRPLIPLIVRLV